MVDKRDFSIKYEQQINNGRGVVGRRKKCINILLVESKMGVLPNNVITCNVSDCYNF